MALSGDPYLRDKLRVRRNFSRAARSYDQVAVLQQTVGARLLERLDVITLQPARILDLGSGTGRFAAQLAQRYAAARVLQLDLSPAMLRQSATNSAGAARHTLLCADAENLPVADACVDFVFSNLMLQWATQLDQTLQESRRILRPGGLLLFSTFGPDSLRELRASWAGVDDHVHVNAFTDMHDVGDGLLRAGFVAPVMETETFTLVYKDGLALLRELKALGAGNANAGRRKSLTGKRNLQAMLAAYQRHYGADGLPATFEAIYGHAWAPELQQQRPEQPQPGVYPVAFRARPGAADQG